MAKMISFVRKVCALAMVSLLTHCVWAAATPIVFWNGDFETTSKTVGNETYTLNLNGNTVATDGSYVEITDTERKGVEVSWSTPLVDCTILMQYEGLTQTAKTYPIALLGLSTASYTNVDGLAINGSDRVVKAYWANNYYYSGGDKTITMDGNFGIISLRYSSSGTFARVKEGESSWAELYGNSGIKGNGTYEMTRAFFGGSNAFVKSDGTSSMSIPTGMKITAIAIFPANTALTDCDEYVFPVVEKKDYSRWASAPAIFSYVSGENVHNANYQLLDAATGKCGSTFGGATANTNIPRQGGNSITPWNVFVEKSGYKYVAPGYVLHFGPDATRHNTIDASFEPFNIGGLIVETGATGYGLTGTGARSTTFGDTRSSNGVETWQYIGEDFTINRQGAVTLKGTINIEVAQDKVYDLNSTQTTHNLVLDTATHAALKFHGKGNIKVNTLTATGAVTLDFSDLEVANAPFITGNLTIDASTKIVFPANLAENTAYQVCSGTLTAPEAATSRQIVQIGEDAVYAKIVYDAANKSIKYVSAEDDDFVFTGATDNNWSTAANWNKGAVPTTGATAIIPAGKKAQFTATTSLGNGVIVVQKGGTVDVNGKIGLNNYVISGDGEGNGALINTSTAAINFNQGGITSLKLCGDASIGGAGWWGMKNGGQAIDLGIYTLTVKVRNGNYGFVSSPVAISGTGTIKVAPSGTFWLYAGADTNEPITLMDGTLDVAAGGVLSPERAPLTVKNLVMNGSVIQNKAVTINGTLSGTGTIKNTALASGATIDVSEGVLTLSGTLTVGENLTVKVAEPVESGVPVAVMNLSGSAFGAGSDIAKVSVVVDDSQQDGAFYLSVNADATKLVVRKLGEGDSLMTEIKGSTILAPLVISGYTHAITGFGGAEIQSLSLVGETARLVIDPPRTPAKINSKPVFDGGKIRLAPVYDDVACGKYVLLTWNGATLDLDADGLKGLVDIVCGKDYTVEEVMNGSLRQLVLKVGDYDNEAKQIIWEPMGDSITEGIIKDNAKGTPNYRIPTAQRLEAIGYKVVTRGFRQIGCTDANGVAAAEAHGYHDGISAERVWTGLRSGVKRAGFIEALEAHLESAGIPDVITLKIGTNDIIGNDNPQHVFEGWTNIVNRIIANRPTTKIIVTTIIDVSGTTNDDAYNTLIKDYCAKSEAEGGFPAGHVFLIDQNPVVLRNSSPAMYLSDAVHPTWYGHQKMADCWFDGFKTALAAADIGTYEPVGTKYGAENTVPAEYSEGFKKIAEFDKITGKMTDWNGEVYSSVNEALAAKKLKRIAYYVERKTVNSPDNRFVWVDMDAWQDEATLANSGIPTDETTRANKVVNNLHIYSNSTGIQNVEPNVSGVRGTLLFTNKSLTDATGITDAPASQYELDWNNTLNDNSDLGAMIVSRLFEGATLNNNNNLLAPAEVLFSFNGFAKAGRKNVFGIGSFPIHSKYNVGNSALSKLTMNWVCNLDDEVYPLTAADQLTSGKIEIWGVPETVTIEIPAAPTGAEVEVTVEGETAEVVDGSIEATPGAEVVVTYSAAEGYIMTPVVTTFSAGDETTIQVPAAGDITQAVAKIDTTLYPSLAAAVGEAENAQTITIIGDVSSEKVAIENKVIYISGAINGRNVDCECEVPMKNGDMLFGDLEMAVAEVTRKGYSPFVVDKSVLFKMHKGVKIESDIVLPPYANTNSAIYFDATHCGMDEQTLDLNGHTISQTQGGPGGYWWSSVHVNCATVKIVDTSKEQTGKITGIGSCITITGYDEYQGSSFPAQVTLASGTLTVTGKPQKAGSNTYYAENGIVGIFYSGKFIMTGGKIDAVADLDPNGKVAGVIADGANTTYGKPSVTITGGEIIGVPLDHQIARKPGIPLSTDGIFAGAIVSEKTIKISGGTFSSPLNLEYCADDCYPTVINGVYGVCTDPVAKIGDMYYTTLQGAADAAANGDTIELLAEAHLEGLSVSGKAVIIVHTKTVSGTTQYFLKLGSAYIGEQKDSGAIPLLNSVDVPGGDKISPAVDAECVTKYTYSSGDHTWKQPIVVGDLTKCVAIATGSEYIPTTTKKPYLISYFISKNITLEDDMELPLRTTISGSLNFCGDNLVFDLNGHTLKQGVYVNGYPAVAVKAGSLTIKDSVGTGKIIGATNGLNIENGAQCVVESGSIMTMGCWNEKVHGSCVIAQNDAELTIKGGVFGDDSFYVDNPKTDGTLWAMNATVSITGGEFRAPTNEDAWDGTAICAYSYTAGKTASVTISGDPVVYGWVYPYQTAGSAAMSISGGQFDTPVNKYYGKLTVDGYEVVINDNGLYEPLPKTPDLEIKVSEDGKTITPSVTSEGTAVVVNQETLEETEELPQETGLYGVIVKNVAGKSTGTSLIGVIKVKEEAVEKNTIAVAVPFTGATVANLLNTALLNEGDTLTAYLHTGYETWTLTEGKWVGLSMTRAGGETSNGLPDSTSLVRGQAVWVTTAGQVVVLGTYDDSTEIAKADEAVNLLANPTMKDYEVPISDVDTEVFNVGDLSAVYKVVKDSQTQEDVWQCTESVTTIKNGVPMTKPVVSKKAPSIKVGKGYWLRKAKESK